MFLLNPPTVRTLDTFSALPAKYRQARRTVWGDANQGGRAADSFLEGPVFDAQGNLYVTDIPFGRVFRIDPKGEWELVAQWDGEPNGMKFMSPTELLITDYLNGLMVLDVTRGSLRPLLARRNTESFKGVNDLCFDRHGNLFFTDQGQTGLHDPTGRVYRLRADGTLDLLLANAPSPNGLAVNEDASVLFVAVTRGNQVWRAPLLPDGSLSKMGAFQTFFGTSGPDGLALLDHDRLLVAHASLGGVFVLNARGEVTEFLRSTAGPTVTNVAVRPGTREVVMTESSTGSLLVARL